MCCKCKAKRRQHCFDTLHDSFCGYKIQVHGQTGKWVRMGEGSSECEGGGEKWNKAQYKDGWINAHNVCT